MRNWLSKRIERKADIEFEKLVKLSLGPTAVGNFRWYIRKKYVKILYSLAAALWKN